MLGNLVENAAKYGGGRVFVTVEPQAPARSISWSRTTARASRPSARRSVHARRAARHHRQAGHRPWPRDRPRRRRNLRRDDPPRGKRRSRRPAGAADAARRLGAAAPSSNRRFADSRACRHWASLLARRDLTMKTWCWRFAAASLFAAIAARHCQPATRAAAALRHLGL